MLKVSGVYGVSRDFELGIKFVCIKNCIIFIKLRWIRKFRGGKIFKSGSIIKVSRKSGRVIVRNIRNR